MQAVAIQEEWNRSLQRFIQTLLQSSNQESDDKSEGNDHRSPASLQGAKIDDILKKLERMLTQPQYHFQEVQKPLFEAELENHFAVFSRSVAEYLEGLLPAEHKATLHQMCRSDILHSLCSEMRLPATNGHFATSVEDSLHFVTRAALQASLGDLRDSGYLLFSKIPTLYFSPCLASIAEHIQQQLFLPKSSIRLLPTGLEGKVDLTELESMIEKDKEQRLPLLVVFDTDQTSSHSLDSANIAGLQNLCTVQNVWLHVQGTALATLFATPSKVISSLISSANSFSVFPAQWGGLSHPSLQHVCIFFRDSEFMPASSKFSSLNLLPLWMELQKRGKAWLRERVSLASKWAADMKKQLTQNKSILLRSSDGDLTLYFRFVPSGMEELASIGDPDENIVQKLNKQMLIDLSGPGGNRESLGPALGVDMQLLDGNYSFHFAPLLFSKLADIRQEDISAFVDNLTVETQLIDSSLLCQKTFKEMVEKQNDFHYVNVDSFIGIGAIRYFPAFLKTSAEMATELGPEIDELNVSLAKKLAEVDGIFSEGKTVDGHACTCVGIDTSPATEESATQYLHMVLKTAQALDLYTTVRHRAEEIIVRKMQEAKLALQREQETRAAQEGYMRRIPLIGGVWGWLNKPVDTDVPAHLPPGAVIVEKERRDSATSSPVRTPTATPPVSDVESKRPKETPQQPSQQPAEVVVVEANGHKDNEKKKEAIGEQGGADDDEQQPPPENDNRDEDETQSSAAPSPAVARNE